MRNPWRQHPYSDVPCASFWLVTVLLFLAALVVKANPLQKRVIGGNYAPPSKFPWAVSIRGDIHADETTVVCGSTLISDRWLLTAAHCFYTQDSSTGDVVDMRDPSLWHLTAGQVLVNLGYEKENRQTNSSKSYEKEIKEPSEETKPEAQPVEIEVCQEEQERAVKVIEEAAQCWEKLIPGIDSPVFDKSMKKLRYMCKKLQKQMEKLALAYYKCLEENIDGDSVFPLFDKRDSPTMQAQLSHFHLERIVIHEKYTPDDIEYDIALIKLDKPMPFNELKNVAAVKLPSAKNSLQYPPVGKNCVIVGWGCTEAKGDANPKAKFAELEVITNQRCNEVYENGAGLNDKHEFCAGFVNKKIGICPGDSGSGLVCQTNPNEWTVAGVTSATHAEDPGSFPGLFTRVSFFVGWIESVMKKY